MLWPDLGEILWPDLGRVLWPDFGGGFGQIWVGALARFGRGALAECHRCVSCSRGQGAFAAPHVSLCTHRDHRLVVMTVHFLNLSKSQLAFH